MQVGPYTLSNPWILAPMAGVSEMPFRVLARRMGAGAAPTELVSAKGLLYGQERTYRYLTHVPEERPFWVQLFGGDADSMARGAERAVELGADILDINMGCPVKKVTRHGAGSALLCDLERGAAIVDAMTRRTGKPVTVKIRCGWDDDTLNYAEAAHRFADAGAVAIAMHARTRAQGYSGKARWDLIRSLVAASPIPVIGNGDVFTAEDAHRMKRETGCAAVMIGRGALGNPWIFSELTGSTVGTSRWGVIRAHLHAHVELVGDATRAVRKFRQHLIWYSQGIRGAAGFRARMLTLERLEDVLSEAEEFFDREGAKPALCQGSAREIEFDTRAALG